MCYYIEQTAYWTKVTKNWEWNSGAYIFIVLFLFSPPQDYAIKAEMYLELLSFIFGGPK